VSLKELSILDCYLITHRVFPDERGIFREWFRDKEIHSIDEHFSVKQANYSKSKKWVIRGIHYSLAPDGQAKLITCANGEIIDVLVDLRDGSPTYLQVEYVELSENSGRTIYIPTGVGHGFVVKSDSASVVYLTSSEYIPEYEQAICPIDPDLGIKWPVPNGEVIVISKTDQQAQNLFTARASGLLPKFVQN
jgi:dTDP-4-dehydrorhamnose 3,5-epimerase